LARFDPATGRFAVFRHSDTDPGSLGDDNVFALLEDASGGVWLGTTTGLDRLDIGTARFRHYRHDENDPASLSYPLVTSMAPGLPGKVWVGTYRGGVNELDVATGRFRALGSDRVISLLTDSGGTLWIGTWGAGLNRLRRSALLLAASPEVPVPAGLTDIDTDSVGRDRRGRLWIGTGTGALLRYDPVSRAWRRYLSDDGPSILQIAETRDGSIWAGTPVGLVRLDPETGKSTVLPRDPHDPASLGPGYVKSLLEDREGRFWVGTGEGGLHRLDAAGRVVERFRPHANDPASLSDDYVTAIVEDRQGMLWVGTRSGGLNAFDPRSGRAVRYQPTPGRNDGISHHSVISIFEDSKGRLWIGTAGGGLNRVEGAGKDARFTRFTTAEGLADNNVMAILEDDDGSLWLSTKRGLSRFDPETKAFANFLVADGLPSAEFAPGAAARIGSVLYFGTVKWLATVSAGAPFPQRIASPTVVTSVRGATDELKDERSAWRLARLSIPYGEWLSLEVAVLDYASELKHAYAYRLGGASAPWVDLGARRSITFTDLAPGTYEFHAKGRNDQGVWSETNTPLTVTVVPPFWMTPWFRAAVAAAILAAAILIHLGRTAALTKRNRELVELHAQRERARLDLNGAYERLRLLARRLELAKEEERKTIARELHDELGPTLTAVVINLQLLKDAPDADRRSRKIADTIEIVDRMIQKIREISLDLRPPLLDEMGLLTALRGYLETLAERSGLAIDLRGDDIVDRLPPEVEIVAFRVVQEAVTNVVRHAKATRAVVTVERKNGRLGIAVEDDGTGFDVAASIHTAATGNALGLLGMQERVLMLAGELEIVPAPAGGTLVRASLPVEAIA
jgi:signal transduction histidine kinase/streptogramin lyase